MIQQIYIGCSSYYNKKWIGIFYPEALPRSKWFEYYCSHFNTYELNSTFYKSPTIKTLQTWYGKAPENFIYSVKAPKTITHIKKFEACEKEIAEFYSVCREGLQDKLGCILFQLPPSFKYSPENLDLIINSLNTEFKNVVEFRNESWFIPEVYNVLSEHNICFCTVSHPSLTDAIVTTTDTLYIRLHGKPKMFYSEYSADELENYSKAISENKSGSSFIYFNNTADTGGIINVLAIKKSTNGQQ